MTYEQPHDPWNGQAQPPPHGPPPGPGTTPPYGPVQPSYPTAPPPAQGPTGRSWWRRWSLPTKIGLIAAAALLLCCSGLTAIGAIGAIFDTPNPSPTHAAAIATSTATAPNPPATTAPSATEAPSPTAAPAPVVEIRTITETRPIPYQTRRVNDSSLAAGTTKVRTNGVAGLKTLTYEVTYTDEVQTSKKLTREVVTRAPVTRVIAVGTKQAPRCDPNYSGACVPIASDVDCAGGSGNGPAYVEGPVRVIGRDIYNLDDDGDGIGCE